MKRIIVLNGVHSSGKSTIGKSLAERDNRLEFFYEIGGELRDEVDYNSLTTYDEYDAEIFRRELLRDSKLIDTVRIPVVETWHVGNIAYAMLRSPSLVPGLLSGFEARLKVFDPVFIAVTIDSETFLKRARENIVPYETEEAMSFFRKVYENMIELYGRYQLNYFEIENNGGIEGAIDNAARELRNYDLLENQMRGKERG